MLLHAEYSNLKISFTKRCRSQVICRYEYVRIEQSKNEHNNPFDYKIKLFF